MAKVTDFTTAQKQKALSEAWEMFKRDGKNETKVQKNDYVQLTIFDLLRLSK